MKINKCTVTLKGEEILRLFELDVNFSNMSKYEFENYNKALKLLRELKKQLNNHANKNK